MLARRLLLPAMLCAAYCLVSVAVYAQTDQAAAERILGPQWKQHSRQAGMIFSGTVLSGKSAGANDGGPVSGKLVGDSTAGEERVDGRPIGGTFNREEVNRAGAGPVTTIPLRFRVDTAIAGVEAGQVLTIYEWAGAETLHPPMQPGQHLLLFLYPRSRLGLTSPVGGAQGQILLSATGTVSASRPAVMLDQLTRAIRWARGGKR